MRDVKRSPRGKPDGRKPDGSTRIMLLLAGAALVLILLVACLLAGLLSGLKGEPAEKPELTAWLAENWTIFRVRSWDPETGALELDYPIRFTYEQMKKYGRTLEELRDLPVGNLTTAAALKTAARESAGTTIRALTIYGLTTDGETAYTVRPDGTIDACWESP